MSVKTKQMYTQLVESRDYDVRKTHSARWIDQKVTPDVLAFIAETIINFVEETGQITFTSKDLWESDFARSYLIDMFKKVDPASPSATHEYDKTFQQPLKMLSYSGVLSETRPSRSIIFKIEHPEILDTLIHENDALDFLVIYNTKVLKDSGLYGEFDNFFREQTKDSYVSVKAAFESFIHKYTPVKKEFEPKRMFAKVINPIAFSRNCCGTRKGTISKTIIEKSELMYNRGNFRDVKKPKGMTRKQYAALHPDDTFSCSVFTHMSEKAKKFVKHYNEEHNRGLSEIATTENTPSLQIHHMFMSSEFPEISFYIENLIALTPNQHNSFAHPNNNTNVVDPKYRCKCLVNKLKTIRIDGEMNINEYDIDRFKEVLAVGFSDESFKEIVGADYDAIEEKIREICITKYKCNEESLSTS